MAKPRQSRAARARGIAAVGVLLIGLLDGSSWAGDDPTQHGVVFAEYPDNATNDELARRTLSPLVLAKIERKLALSGRTLGGQPLNLPDERFLVHVPPQAPPGGYGVIVFVPPWTDARLPDDWGPVLDRYGFIFVSAAGSGNDASILGRREPLALVAAANIRTRYRVDDKRVFVAGLSGGSRVALRLAVAYPDVFHAAILNSGSDPIGTSGFALPPRELFMTFQARTRLVYLTGDQDSINLDADGGSRASMRTFCVFNVSTRTMPLVGHDIARPNALADVLAALNTPEPTETKALIACRSATDEKLAAAAQHAKDLIARGDRVGASKLVKGLDEHFGGLASPWTADTPDADAP